MMAFHRESKAVSEEDFLQSQYDHKRTKDFFDQIIKQLHICSIKLTDEKGEEVSLLAESFQKILFTNLLNNLTHWKNLDFKDFPHGNDLQVRVVDTFRALYALRDQLSGHNLDLFDTIMEVNPYRPFTFNNFLYFLQRKICDFGELAEFNFVREFSFVSSIEMRDKDLDTFVEELIDFRLRNTDARCLESTKANLKYLLSQADVKEEGEIFRLQDLGQRIYASFDIVKCKQNYLFIFTRETSQLVLNERQLERDLEKRSFSLKNI